MEALALNGLSESVLLGDEYYMNYTVFVLFDLYLIYSFALCFWNLR